MSEEKWRELTQLAPFRHAPARDFTFPAVRLYLGDLREICDLLSSAYPTLIFVVDDWTFFELDQFPSVTQQPVSEMSIVAGPIRTDPSDGFIDGVHFNISVLIFRRLAVVKIADSDNTRDLGVATRIADILQSRRSGFPKQFTSPHFLFGVSIVTFSLSIMWGYSRWTSLQVQLIVIALSYVMWAVLWGEYFRRTSKVYPTDRVEFPSFMQEHKHDLFLIVITAVVTTILNTIGVLLLFSLGIGD